MGPRVKLAPKQHSSHAGSGQLSSISVLNWRSFTWTDSNPTFQASQERFLGELQEFCRKPSIVAQGIGIEETAEWVGDRLRRAGFESKVMAVEGGAPVVYSEIGSGDKTLMIYNHYDVQPPEPLGTVGFRPIRCGDKSGPRVGARCVG